MDIVCSDLEGVFVPEIWIAVAEKAGVPELRLTTRDIPDYDELMQRRLSILKRCGLKLADIQAVIAGIEPLDGARDFLMWLRRRSQVIIVSDTFSQFAGPLMEKLAWPTLFCNTLNIGPDGDITDYTLRQADGKRHVVQALSRINYRVIAFGDSYNDVGMLQQAAHGMFFRPPPEIAAEFAQFPVCETYGELQAALMELGLS